jgi:transposase
MRCIGLDVHRDFCEVAIAEEGCVHLAGRVATEPASLVAFARRLEPTDEVAMEATGNALAIARILEPHVGRVVLAHPPAVRAATSSRVKTDRIDARRLAQLLAGGFLAEVWTPDEATRLRQRLIARRAALVRQRTREKNQIHAALMRNLTGRPPMSDLFGVAGRRWLAAQELPADERHAVDAGLRLVDLFDQEVAEVERLIAEQVLESGPIRRLMTLPGVSAITATALMAAIGDVRRFPSARHLVAYLGLNPQVHQSGSEPARHGRISKQGPGEARHLLVEAAWHALRTAGPLRAFGERVRARRGANIATIAVARKLVVIAWHMLTQGEDYAFVRPSLMREKVRRLELMLGAERRQGRRNPERVFASVAGRAAERAQAVQAEEAYRRMMRDWRASGAGAGATMGRASSGRLDGTAARQTSEPQAPAL